MIKALRSFSQLTRHFDRLFEAISTRLSPQEEKESRPQVP